MKADILNLIAIIYAVIMVAWPFWLCLFLWVLYRKFNLQRGGEYDG